MKFLIGLIFGAAAAAYIVTNMNDEQRERATQSARNAAAKARGSKTADTLSDKASDLADAADRRASSVIGDRGEQLTNSVDANTSTTSSTTP